ncbi:MAG: sulfotransferase family 2 domain-containing protein [Chloroflexaceae bacterium]|nr:sulfotransferase family 2 domain-containing protein [Chloroflexaceae bacterium]
MTRNIQYTLREQDMLCFLHLPKTGGTTLVAILCSVVGSASFQNLEHTEVLHRWTIARYYRVFDAQIVHTHAHYRRAIGVLPRKPVLLTMLRHPLKRVVSEHGQYLKTRQDASQFVSLDDFILNPECTDYRPHNKQTAVLAGLSPRALSDLPPHDALALAKAHLDECAFVGITEHFDESLRLLCYTFGWSPIEHCDSRNVTPSALKYAVTPELESAILERNQLDIALYAYAQQLFADRLQRMKAERERLPSTL